MTTASAPASSANLGPGYDVLALALDLRCTVTVEPADVWEVMSGGEPATEQTVEMVRAVAGEGPWHVSIDSAIPQAAGLGSSAAVLAAAAAACADGVDRNALFGPVAAAEGHPDNVAAAVYGGLVAATTRGVERLAVHPDLHVVVAVPDEQLPTQEARAAVPDRVSTEVASRTAARLMMLVEGLRTGDPVSFQAALGDEIHEAPRAAITATPGRLIDAALDAGALYAAWSGAGPSVIALCIADLVESVCDGLIAAVPNGHVLRPAIDREGVRIE